MRRMKKLLIKSLIALLCVVTLTVSVNSYAATGYTYDHNKKVIYSTEGLIYDHSYNGDTLGMGFANLQNPTDLFLYKNPNTFEVECMYLTDSNAVFPGEPGKGAIYKLDKDFHLLETFSHFTLDPAKKVNGEYVFSDYDLLHIKSGGNNIATEATLNDVRNGGPIEIYLMSPRSSFRYVVTKLEGDPDNLYVCDYGNNQVIVYNCNTEEITLVITDPNRGVPGSVYGVDTFQPLKVVADNAGRIYVIADGVFEGILQFDQVGMYKRFTGVNYITLTAWNIFWLAISTEEQYANKQQYDNTTFTGMALDSTGTFIYSTSNPIKNDNGSYNILSMVKKLNPAGKDVLTRNGYYPPQGDILYIASAPDGAPYPVGPSSFRCIAVNEYGMYTVIDSNRNKLFSYDDEGHMLYISSESGKYSNTLDNPVAIQYYGNDLLVLDQGTKEIKVFVPTEIGSYINEATILESKGLVDEAAEAWKKVIQYNANYEYAYVGVGKGYLKNKEYKLAMEYFRKGSNKLQYSEAYKLHRNGLIKQYAPIVLYVAIGVGVTWAVVKKVLVKKGIMKNKKKEKEDLGE